MSWKKNYTYWSKYAPKEIKTIINDYSIQERKIFFSFDLEFGTAGIRNKMGYGSNKINEFTVAKYSYAFGKLLLKKYGDVAKKTGILIAHDNRKNNILFSTIAAKTIMNLNIPVTFFKNNELQPTPLLSYSIFKKKFIGGINVTASHNFAEYNGLKMYNHYGSQLSTSESNIVLKEAKKIANIFNIKQSNNKINEITKEIEDQYVDDILNKILFKKFNQQRKNFKVIFTPQHGTATNIAQKILKKMNVDFILVEEQAFPDENFINTKSPNPQDEDSFILAREYGSKNNADIIFCTDPDADRFGIEVFHNNNWIHIDGNQLPLIQLNYKLKMLNEKNKLNERSFVVKSIVTSKAIYEIVKKYPNVKIYESLTGFKWIIDKVLMHIENDEKFLFAWEESYGSINEIFTHDKDSFQALAQIIEIAYECKKNNHTLVDELKKIYDEIGFWYSPQIKLSLEENENLSKKLNNLSSLFKKIKIGSTINKDYILTNVVDFSKGYKNFEKNNIIMFEINSNHLVTFRPSGTEPTLRIYFDICGSSKENSFEIFKILKEYFMNFL